MQHRYDLCIASAKAVCTAVRSENTLFRLCTLPQLRQFVFVFYHAVYGNCNHNFSRAPLPRAAKNLPQPPFYTRTKMSPTSVPMSVKTAGAFERSIRYASGSSSPKTT